MNCRLDVWQNRRNANWGGPVYLRPKTVHEAVRILSQTGVTVLSGGTDFFPARVDRPNNTPVVDISAIEELKGITIEADRIHIGGRTTWSEIAASSLPSGFDCLRSAAREVGSIQIQNFATVAGNLCNASPAADGVPPLLALDAQVRLVSLSGSRDVPLSDFILGNRKTDLRPDEIMTRIIIPSRLLSAGSAFLKLGARRYLVISIVMVAALVLPDRQGRIAEAHVAVGSCSARARRLIALENALVGKPAEPGLGRLVLSKHLAPLAPIDDVRATAEYRRYAALVLVQRALDACVGEA
jgi:CO/xanthine dehydrogenase FAD-binding subunit